MPAHIAIVGIKEKNKNIYALLISDSYIKKS
jgi:hypothetical protein